MTIKRYTKAHTISTYLSLPFSLRHLLYRSGSSDRQVMSIRRTAYPTLFSFGFTSTSKPSSQTSPKISPSIIDLALDNMSQKVEVLLYLNVFKTIRSWIELMEICETETDGSTVSILYSLRTDWRSRTSSTTTGFWWHSTMSSYYKTILVSCVTMALESRKTATASLPSSSGSLYLWLRTRISVSRFTYMTLSWICSAWTPGRI
jgi:hypothetical protein